jgi:hypothetical protein
MRVAPFVALAGIVDLLEYGVRAKRGDFEPLISEELFYRVQAVLSGRVPSTTPQHPNVAAVLRSTESATGAHMTVPAGSPLLVDG